MAESTVKAVANNDVTEVLETPDKDTEVDIVGLEDSVNVIANNEQESPMEEWKMLTLSQEILCTNVGELEEAVALCSAAVKSKEKDTPEWNMLVRRLIELKLRLHNLQQALKDEEAANEPMEDRCVVLGHHFLRQHHPKSLATFYCDRCSGVIWNAIHSWHLCTDCEYRCHTWCLAQVCRVCAHMVATEAPSYDMNICPEAPDGLASQNYRCAECLIRTKLGCGTLEPRLCDYNGKYYCATCHWNSMAVIPARVVSNWDFTERRVCRATKQRLKILANLPNLRLEELNPVLFASVDELINLKKLRKRLLLMKKYLMSCKSATESKLPWQMKGRLHFMECDDKYSLQDLQDLKSGVLIDDITRVMSSFSLHIKVNCSVCQGHGYICELCIDEKDEEGKRKVKEIIFPFEEGVECCPECSAAYHLPCYRSNNRICPKCARRLSRQHPS